MRREEDGEKRKEVGNPFADHSQVKKKYRFAKKGKKLLLSGPIKSEC